MKLNKVRRNGPLQIVHDFKFVALNVKDDYSFVDSLCNDDKKKYFKERIDRLYRLGYGGVVINVDYKNYLRDEAAFDCFAYAAEYAGSLGMRVWVYDEQYYPSGSAGGLTLEGHPELEAICLSCVIKDVQCEGSAVRIPSPYGYSDLKYAFITPIIDGAPCHAERIEVSEHRDLGGGLCYHAPPGRWRVYCFFVRPLFELTKFCQGYRASRRYISIFNRRAVERFYDVTFGDGYCKHLTHPLSDTVEAVFTDEPYSPFYREYVPCGTRTAAPSESVYDEPDAEIKIYPYVPWEMSAPDRYFEKYGESITAVLPDLFEQTHATAEARIRFYSVMSDMAREAFPVQMQSRLGDLGVNLSGHYYGEEGFDFQPNFYGDILEHLGAMAIPGCDCLWSDINVLRYSVACKLASSAAHMFCRDEVMIEASNMVDKDQAITLKKAKAAISAMFIHGINLITSYYGENMLPERDILEFTDHIATLKGLFDGGRYKVNTLLYYPFENLCALCGPQGVTEGHDNGADSIGIAGTSAELMKHQVCFDFINKKGLLSCEMCDGYLLTKNGNRIEYIVFPAIPWLDSEVARYLENAKRHGVEIVFDKDDVADFGLCFTPHRLSEHYPESSLSLVNENPYITAMNWEFDGYELFMLMNTEDGDENVSARLSVGDDDGSLFLLDTSSGEEKPLPIIRDGDRLIADIEIPPLDFVIILKSK